MSAPDEKISLSERIAQQGYEAMACFWINPSQISAAWLVLAVPGAVTSILSESPGGELTGIGIFTAGRLLDILDGKYARFLMKQHRWSSEFDGATFDSHCDKAGIYIPLFLFLYAHSDGDIRSVVMILTSLLMGSLDLKSTFMRSTNWPKIAESLRGGNHLLKENQESPVVPNNPANTANGWWKAKAVAQTVWVGLILAHETMPEWAVAATMLLIAATVCSLVSLAKKMQLKKAQTA